MTAFRLFTKRNMQIYFRDRGCVFFSLLSMLILILLMVLFLGDMYAGDIGEVILAFNPGLDPETVAGNSAYYIRLWTLGGVLSINAVTITMMAMSAMVRDETSGKTMSFLVSPLDRSVLTICYIFSSWVISLIMSMVTLACSEAFLAICGNALLNPMQLLKLLGMIGAYSLVAACIAYLISVFVHSIGAWSGILTLIGTLIGFAGGCYIPITSLSEPLQSVLKFMPFIHGAAMMRTICVESASAAFAGIPSEVMDEINIQVGNTIVFEGHTFLLWEQLLVFLIYVILTLGISMLITRNRRLKAR